MSKQARFEILDDEELDPPKRTYFISDPDGGKVQLSPNDAFRLLEWLYQQRSELFRLTNDLPDE